MECRRLSNSGKRKRIKKRKSVNVITGKSLVEGEKENRKMIIEIALLVINEFTPEHSDIFGKRFWGFCKMPATLVKSSFVSISLII